MYSSDASISLFRFRYDIDTILTKYRDIVKHRCSCTTRSQFFTERVINLWSLPCDVVDFATLSTFKHCLEMVDLSKFCSLV